MDSNTFYLTRNPVPEISRTQTAADDTPSSNQKKRYMKGGCPFINGPQLLNPLERCSKLNKHNLLIIGYTKIASLTFFGKNSLVRGLGQYSLTAVFENTQDKSLSLKYDFD